ncbi:MAG: YgcG family protein, partial [Thiobacillus sp.]|nr:YgcG family protein [Thiobacillus sp.]
MRLWRTRAVLGLWLALCAALVWAQVAVPELTRRVTDLTGTLTAAQTDALEARLAQFEAQKGSQIAVLIVPTTAPEDIAQFGIRVADAWKIGRQKIDDGVILIVAKQDRALRIEVGYGLEGAIPDAVAKRVVAETIAPRFKAGDFYGGIDAGVTQLMKLIEGEALPPPTDSRAREPDEASFVLLVMGGIVAGALLSVFLGRPAAAGVAAVGSGALGALLIGLSPLLLLVALFVFAAVAGGFRGGGWSSGG